MAHHILDTSQQTLAQMSSSQTEIDLIVISDLNYPSGERKKSEIDMYFLRFQGQRGQPLPYI